MLKNICNIANAMLNFSADFAYNEWQKYFQSSCPNYLKTSAEVTYDQVPKFIYLPVSFQNFANPASVSTLPGKQISAFHIFLITLFFFFISDPLFCLLLFFLIGRTCNVTQPQGHMVENYKHSVSRRRFLHNILILSFQTPNRL